MSGMTAAQAYQTIKKQLSEGGIPDAAFEAAQLLAHLNLERFSQAVLSEAQWQQLQALATRRTKREPLQYLLGEWAFMGVPLKVGPGVLIPRADTECVCEAALATLTNVAGPNVVDLCAGSGALALGIAAARPDASVTAVELDEAAFSYLAHNIASFGQEATMGKASVGLLQETAKEAGQQPNQHGVRAVRPVRADALTYYKQLSPFSVDLITCNPPYVTAPEYEALEAELYHEPRQALVAEDNGLLFYKTIAPAYYSALNVGGALVFEIGAGQGGEVETILRQSCYEGVEILPDYAGKPRVAIGKKYLAL